MLPWHPSGPRAPALPPTADAPWRTPRIPDPLTARGLSHEKKGSPPRCPPAATQSPPDAAFIHVPEVYFSAGVSYQKGPLGSLEVLPLCFNTLLAPWLSHTHTAFNKQTPMMEMHWNDVSWRRIAPPTLSSNQIIVSRYAGGWFERDTDCEGVVHIPASVWIILDQYASIFGES